MKFEKTFFRWLVRCIDLYYSGNGEDIVLKKKIDIDAKIQLVVNKIQNRVTTKKA